MSKIGDDGPLGMLHEKVEGQDICYESCAKCSRLDTGGEYCDRYDLRRNPKTGRLVTAKWVEQRYGKLKTPGYLRLLNKE